MLTGILIGILLMSNLGFIYCCLYLQKKIEEKPEEPKKKITINEDEKEKVEKIRKHFDNLMNYDYERALKRGDIKADR